MTSTEDILRIAVNVVHSGRGDRNDFLRTFADAYLRADQENEKILRPAWLILIEKYNLGREAWPR